MAGDVEIRHHTFINLFNIRDQNLKFFILPNLKSFHGILGNESLKQLGAIIFTRDNYMLLENGMKIKIFQMKAQSVNAIKIKDDHMTVNQKKIVNTLVATIPNLFAEPNRKLTYTTKVIGEIRTKSESPVYTRYYPYPMSLKSEVEKQIQEMLHDGIIRPSRSPYNSPVWIVPKKPDAAGNKQYRVVTDYRKLNAVTVADKYPIPDITEVLSQLGNNQFFSVLDLKSGFHQIPLKESDIEKTAFSISNGKYEYTRLAFGLKNAPSIFQRALDDILRKCIGEFCYVYIDDIIVFSKTENDHAQHLEKIFKILEDANMKVQLDKCHFFKQSVEFLGFIITSEGITTNPAKTEAIAKIPPPTTLKELRSFLGLSGYYRRFVQDYAKLAKPLTSLLRGKEGRMSKNKSAGIKINLDVEAIEAFNKIKSTLVSRDIMLTYPNFGKDFTLTTDASNFAIGAVLSQDDKPIMFISRTLSKTEENYATNEKEMLAIIWALNSLRNYLYGTAKVNIFTDHQPLTYALSNKNNNSKMKRWKAILEEYNYDLHYKPGKANVVADALSRIPRTQINTLASSIHSDESSSHNLICSVDVPINAYKNQIYLNIDPSGSSYEFKIIFPTYHRHKITEPNFDYQNLIEILKKYLNPSVINCIKTDERTMGKIQEIYPPHFSNFKIRFTQREVQDVTDQQEREEIILATHNRAHRNARENKIQIMEKYYFPSLNKEIRRIVNNCVVCKENKYDRHPNKPMIQVTPIPSFPGQIVHLDIFITDKHYVLTAIDKFSKFAVAKVIKSRAAEDIRQPLRDILFFLIPESIIIDNEKSFNSVSTNHMIENEFGIEIYRTPPYKSSSNGQVERFHSTLQELMRCLKTQKAHRTFEELIEKSVKEYNLTVHSITGKKPVEVFYGRTVTTDPKQLEEFRKETMRKLEEKQARDLTYHNQKRTALRTYSEGDVIYVRINKRQGTKLTPKYKKEIVCKDKNSTVTTKSGRTVHKSLIKS